MKEPLPIRIVIEIPRSKKVINEREAVREFHLWFEKLHYCPLKINYWGIKQWTKVFTAERIKYDRTHL